MSTEWARARAAENEARMRRLLEERMRAESDEAAPIHLENVTITFGRSPSRSYAAPRAPVLAFPMENRRVKTS